METGLDTKAEAVMKFLKKLSLMNTMMVVTGAMKMILKTMVITIITVKTDTKTHV